MPKKQEAICAILRATLRRRPAAGSSIVAGGGHIGVAGAATLALPRKTLC